MWHIPVLLIGGLSLSVTALRIQGSINPTFVVRYLFPCESFLAFFNLFYWVIASLRVYGSLTARLSVIAFAPIVFLLLYRYINSELVNFAQEISGMKKYKFECKGA